MNTPAECQTMDHVRNEVDRIDRTLVMLLADRMRYAKKGAEIKASVTPAVPTPSVNRLQQMIAERRAWAVSEGISPELIENIFLNMVAAFRAEEDKHTAST